MELQEKLSMHAGLNQMVGVIVEEAAAAHLQTGRTNPAVVVLQVIQQMQRARMQQRRSELALSQLSDLPDEVAAYKQVGKA
jgi:chaperonin cofactor prefoldin